ncbi:MAG: redoxin domain-containing protein [Planctomycetota bacterium]
MTRSFLVAACLAATAAAPAQTPAASSPSGNQASTSPARPEVKKFVVGSAVDQSITLKDITGKTHTLKDYTGKIVVLDFWSIQCPVSLGYEARLKQLHADYASKGIVFLAIDANHTEVDKGTDPYARIKDYVKQQSIPYPILIDTNNVIADRFDAKTTPHVFILDGTARLCYAGSIDDDPDGRKSDQRNNYVRQALDALLSNREPPTPSTKPHGCTIKRVGPQG